MSTPHINQISRLQAAFKQAASAHSAQPHLRPGHLLYKAEGRTPLFYLEGLSRIGRAIGPERKLAAQWLLRFKAIEDRIGAYDYWIDLHERGLKWQLSPVLLSYFHDRAQHGIGALDDALAHQGWWQPDADEHTQKFHTLDEARAAFTGLDWRGPKKARKKLAGFLRDEILKIHTKLNDGSIDLNATETGIHELRRKLRWLPIYALALNGKLVLDKADAQGPLGRFVTPEIVGHKFNQLPANPEEREPVRFHAAGFYACSFLIAEIGRIKDRALWTHEVMHCGGMLGIEKNEILAQLGDVALPHAQAVAEVRSLVEDIIVKEGLLPLMAKHLDQQAG